MGHTYSNLLMHTVFSTQNRRPLLDEPFRQRLFAYMAGVAKIEFGHAEWIGGTDDHVHGLIRLRTDISMAEAMKKWKSLSSGWVHKTHPDKKSFAWQVGYGAFSVSQSNAETVIRYIDNQIIHHKKLSFEDEFVVMLKRHGIEFNPATMWSDELT